MKDFERKQQTNVTFNESESCNNNQITSEGPASYPTFSHAFKNTDSIQHLKTELQKQLKLKIKNTKGQEFPFVLASKKVKKIIKDYNKGEQIGDVPLNKRLYGKKVFDDHIDRNIKPSKFAYNLRTPLLCNHGVSGSGKTVQQALNMHWFTDRFKSGVAIEITCNDVSGLELHLSKIKDTRQFTSSLMQGIMLRLIEFCYGYNFSDILNNNDNIEQKPQVYQEMIKYRECKWDTLLFNLSFTLKFVREVLNLPYNTPILLAVDELINVKKTKDPEDIRVNL